MTKKHKVVVLTCDTRGCDSTIEFISTKKRNRKGLTAGSAVEQVGHTVTFGDSAITAAEVAAKINEQCPGVHAEVKTVESKRPYRTRIACSSCGRKHHQTNHNCCWISCECGKRICGMCGSTDIQHIDDSELDLSASSDDNYWCCDYCASCGLRGCGMCI